MYLKKKRMKASDQLRNKLFRIGKINELQKNHQWRSGVKEGMSGRFNKLVASQGNKNADEFVSFLGFLRDNSYGGNQNVMEASMDRFFR